MRIPHFAQSINPRPRFNRYSLLMAVGFLLLLLLDCAMVWTGKKFGRVNLDEISLVLQMGVNGVDKPLFMSFIRRVILRSVFWMAILTIAVSMFRIWRRAVVCFILLVVFGISTYHAYVYNFQTGSFFSFRYSDFYEKEYVAPEQVNISFPTKRNVLVIALESIEDAYTNRDMFGPNGLIPNIEKLERQNVSFGRYNTIMGLTHTIAAITGFTTGLPLLYTSYKNVEKMVGATGIGTIFADNGYRTYAIFPASGNFSRKSNFMSQKGFQHIIDGTEIYDTLPEPKPSVKPFGGVDDAVLFEYAKPVISDIIKDKKPYFLFMETINTHLKGYATDTCTAMGFEQTTFDDIIRCDDKIISDFVKWFRQRDPGAVVILLNDHRQHGGNDMADILDTLDERNMANVFINTPIFKGVDLMRPVSAMDFFPTIIEAAGGIIDGCRLGMGVSLGARCAAVKTLRERYEADELDAKIQQRNKLYIQLNTENRQ